jgi:hypothetical protein
MSKINRLPRGFQDFLGNTNFGDNPSTLESSVRATVDISPFYAPDEWKVGSEAEQTVNAAGLIIEYEVPEGRIWFLQNVGAGVRRLAGAATDVFAFSYVLSGFPLGSVSASVPVYVAGFNDIVIANAGGNARAVVNDGIVQWPVPGRTKIQLIATSVPAGSSWGVRPNFVYFDLKS